jgi:hypothetical protein
VKYRTYPFDKSVTATFEKTVELDCGCVYDKFILYNGPAPWIRRFRQRCEWHEPIVETWELED